MGVGLIVNSRKGNIGYPSGLRSDACEDLIRDN